MEVGCTTVRWKIENKEKYVLPATNRATKVLSVTYTYDLISFALSLAAAGTCDSELLAAELKSDGITR